MGHHLRRGSEEEEEALAEVPLRRVEGKVDLVAVQAEVEAGVPTVPLTVPGVAQGVDRAVLEVVLAVVGGRLLKVSLEGLQGEQFN